MTTYRSNDKLAAVISGGNLPLSRDSAESLANFAADFLTLNEISFAADRCSNLYLQTALTRKYLELSSIHKFA